MYLIRSVAVYIGRKLDSFTIPTSMGEKYMKKEDFIEQWIMEACDVYLAAHTTTNMVSGLAGVVIGGRVDDPRYRS